MNKALLLLAAACFAAMGARATEGDAAAGQPKAAMCGACHGPDGNSLMPNFPKLAGQHQRYLLKQMQDIKQGLRPVPVMAGQLDNLNDQDLADISAWYASQETTPMPADAAKLELGEQIYRAGISEKGVAACAACHSPTGAGNGPARFPALSGQYAEYIALSLRAFRNDERTNDGDSRMMRAVADRLSDREIEAVASYAASLH